MRVNRTLHICVESLLLKTLYIKLISNNIYFYSIQVKISKCTHCRFCRILPSCGLTTFVLKEHSANKDDDKADFGKAAAYGFHSISLQFCSPLPVCTYNSTVLNGCGLANTGNTVQN